MTMESARERLRVDPASIDWHKSSRSGPNCDNCVEVAFVDGVIAVRDSKNPAGPVLLFTPDEWAAFTGGAGDGEFDLSGDGFRTNR